MLQKTLSKLPRSVHNVFVTLQSKVKKFLEAKFCSNPFQAHVSLPYTSFLFSRGTEKEPWPEKMVTRVNAKNNDTSTNT